MRQILISAFILLMLSINVQAATATWNYTATGDDGSTASGSFSYNDATAANGLSAGADLISWNFLVAGGFNDGLSYTLADLNLGGFLHFLFVADGFTFDLNFTTTDGRLGALAPNVTRETTNNVRYTIATIVLAPAAAQAIPTMSAWALALMVFVIGFIARRRLLS